MTYAMAYRDGMTSVAAWQWSNFDAASGMFTGDAVTTHATIADALATFREIVRGTYRDGVATDDGGPWADLYPVAALSPDDEPSHRLTIGPREGVRVERHP